MDKPITGVIPDCAHWRIWSGPEVEGQIDLGKKTLFVRDGFNLTDHEELLLQYQRVWFCKEFVTEKNYGRIRYVIDSGRNVCIEVTTEMLETVPEDILESAQLYLKIPVRLKDGDHVCVGYDFVEEAFMMGDGQRTEPSLYNNDVRIL